MRLITKLNLCNYINTPFQKNNVMIRELIVPSIYLSYLKRIDIFRYRTIYRILLQILLLLAQSHYDLI